MHFILATVLRLFRALFQTSTSTNKVNTRRNNKSNARKIAIMAGRGIAPESLVGWRQRILFPKPQPVSDCGASIFRAFSTCLGAWITL